MRWPDEVSETSTCFAPVVLESHIFDATGTVLSPFLTHNYHRATSFDKRVQRESLGWDGHSLETLTQCFVGAVVEERVSPPPQPPAGAAGGASDAVADEHQQRPPEFSNTEEAEGYLGEEDGTVLPSAEGSDATAAVAAPTGTLDLHYSGAGIVGSWEVRRLQSGISAALMHRWVVVCTGSCP